YKPSCLCAALLSFSQLAFTKSAAGIRFSKIFPTGTSILFYPQMTNFYRGQVSGGSYFLASTTGPLISLLYSAPWAPEILEKDVKARYSQVFLKSPAFF